MGWFSGWGSSESWGGGAASRDAVAKQGGSGGGSFWGSLGDLALGVVKAGGEYYLEKEKLRTMRRSGLLPTNAATGQKAIADYSPGGPAAFKKPPISPYWGGAVDLGYGRGGPGPGRTSGEYGGAGVLSSMSPTMVTMAVLGLGALLVLRR